MKSVLISLFFFSAIVCHSQCCVDKLSNSQWFTKGIEKGKIALKQSSFLLNERGEYIPDSWEIRILLKEKNKIEVAYVEFDEFQEIIMTNLGEWHCENEIITLDGVSIKGSSKFKIYDCGVKEVILEVIQEKESGVPPR